MPTVEFNDDRAAIAYIKKNGYVSYNSLKNVRDCIEPSFTDEKWFKFGRELHSRDLEKKQIEKLSKPEELQISQMLASLDNHTAYQRLKHGAEFEIAFGPKEVLKKYKIINGLIIPGIMGVSVFGRIDIYKTLDHVTDLKTTKLTNPKAFAESMDFLQAALYLAVTGCRHFYYAGICKQPPYNVMVFNVSQYPKRLKAAQDDLKRLLKYLKEKL